MKRLCGLLAAALPVLAGAGDTFLLRNVAVHTVTKGDIANGAVYVRDGKIAAVGARLNLPKGVRVIDGAGQHLWPGLIDSGTSLGLNEIRSIRESADLSEIGDYNPQLRTLVAINPASDHIPVARANGIAAAITLPEGGVLAGQAALVHLDGWTWEEMDIARAAALHLRFPVLSTRPSSRFSRETSRGTPYTDARREYRRKLQALEDFFEQARRYRKAKVANAPGFKPDVRLEAMLPVLEGTVPVLVTASRERAIRDALEFAEKEKIRIILAAAEDAARLAPELKAKNIPVILGPTFRLPREEDDPYDAPFTLPAE
ncbi:MAG: amidohydrolase, partial [Acidobacteria bacterium]|nr:amidohydrolase [Acidobacteriota bacterium]